MNSVLRDLLARRRYLDAEYFDILARYANCEPYEVSLMQGELDSNKVLMESIDDKINDNMENTK